MLFVQSEFGIKDLLLLGLGSKLNDTCEQTACLLTSSGILALVWKAKLNRALTGKSAVVKPSGQSF